jgi:DNA-directed RNA polymerase subunit N (RpoN/RPB10)
MQPGHCHVCGEKLGTRIHDFHSRTQKVSFDGETKTITVLYELQEMSFCGQECWEAIGEHITEGLHPLYQPLHLVARCSECRKPVDRTQPHYTLNISKLEDISQPWLASMRVLDEKELAVFCPECRVPDWDLSAGLGLLEHEGDSVAVAGPERMREIEPQS